MLITSWNVNSVRARITNILEYLKNSNTDILMMQEIKTEEKNFPFQEFKNAGYNSFVINNPKASSSCGCGLSFSV